MKCRHAARTALLLVAVVASGVAVTALARPWLPPHRPGGFTGLVTSTCALALVCCWAWLALGTVLVAARTLRAARTGASASPEPGLRWVPGTLRVLVPVLVGAAVTAGPASASTGAGSPVHGPRPGAAGAPARLAGLPLPDRVPTPDPADRTVVVRPGDSLWRITARLLPASAPPAAVDRGWRRLARANAARVPDPHLIQPGTRLRVPPLTAHPREEAP